MILGSVVYFGSLRYEPPFLWAYVAFSSSWTRRWLSSRIILRLISFICHLLDPPQEIHTICIYCRVHQWYWAQHSCQRNQNCHVAIWSPLSSPAHLLTGSKQGRHATYCGLLGEPYQSTSISTPNLVVLLLTCQWSGSMRWWKHQNICFVQNLKRPSSHVWDLVTQQHRVIPFCGGWHSK